MKKFLSVVLCLILSLSVFSLTACSEEKESESFLPVVEPTSVSVFSTAVVNADDSLVKQITATVYPLNAPDKSVDWSVHWNENNIGEDAIATDYVTVAPISDGALTANVYCHKAFSNSTLIIRVTTRVGGHSADCIVRYVGMPNDMLLEVNGVQYTQDEIIPLEVRTTSVINLVANDIYGHPTQYGNYYYNFNTGVVDAEIYRSGIKIGDKFDFSVGSFQLFYDLDNNQTNNDIENYYLIGRKKLAQYIFNGLFDGQSNLFAGKFYDGNDLTLSPLFTLDELELNLEYNDFTNVGVKDLTGYSLKFREQQNKGSFYLLVSADYGQGFSLVRQFQFHISPQSAQSVEIIPTELEF